MHADSELRRGSKLRADEVARARREDVVMVEAGCAAVLHEFSHARQARQADDVGVKVFPDFIERLEPVEQLHVLHLRQVAGELLVQMMVRVDQTWIAEHVARVNGLIGGLVEIWADGADDAVFCVEVDVFIHAVFLVARDEACDILNEKCFHGCASCRSNIHIYYTGCGGKCKRAKKCGVQRMRKAQTVRQRGTLFCSEAEKRFTFMV